MWHICACIKYTKFRLIPPRRRGVLERVLLSSLSRLRLNKLRLYLFGKRHVLPLPHACAGSAPSWRVAAPSGGSDRSSRCRIDAENIDG